MSGNNESGKKPSVISSGSGGSFSSQGGYGGEATGRPTVAQPETFGAPYNSGNGTGPGVGSRVDPDEAQASNEEGQKPRTEQQSKPVRG